MQMSGLVRTRRLGVYANRIPGNINITKKKKKSSSFGMTPRAFDKFIAWCLAVAITIVRGHRAAITRRTLCIYRGGICSR